MIVFAIDGIYFQFCYKLTERESTKVFSVVRFHCKQTRERERKRASARMTGEQTVRKQWVTVMRLKGQILKGRQNYRLN